MAKASRPKAIIEKEAKNLIKKITEIEDEKDENFGLCQTFVLSNLLYHKYLDPQESKVVKQLTAIEEKFIIHAQPGKARHLRDLVDRYRTGAVFKEPQYQFDIEYRLLSLLIHLAENPVNVDYEPREASPELEPSETAVDWVGLLQEGEACIQPLGPESDLSDWSEDEEESRRSDSAKVSPQQEEEKEKPRDGEQIENSQQTTAFITAQDSTQWLRDQVQFPYWSEEQTIRLQNATHPAAHFAQDIEAERRDKGSLEQPTRKITEYQLLREILWLLRFPVDSPLFHLSNGRFRPTGALTIPSLSEAALHGVLSDIAESLSDLYALHSFIASVEASSVSRTVEAYASGISLILASFSAHLLTIEQELAEQKVHVQKVGLASVHAQKMVISTLCAQSKSNDSCWRSDSARVQTTLVTLMLEQLGGWRRQLSYLYQLHQQVVGSSVHAQSTAYLPNWLVAVRILSVLYNALMGNVLPELMPRLLDLFLRSVRPYFCIIHTWLVEGRLEDFRDEFLVERIIWPPDGSAAALRNKSAMVKIATSPQDGSNESQEKDDEKKTPISSKDVATDDDFWTGGFRQRDYAARLTAEGIVPAALLDQLMPHIFQSGKSVEILARLDRLTGGYGVDAENNRHDVAIHLFDEFVVNIRNRLSSSAAAQKVASLATATTIADNASKQPKPSLENQFQAIVQSASDEEYLARAFSSMFVSGGLVSMDGNTKEKEDIVAKSADNLIFGGCFVDPMRPLEPILLEAASPAVHAHYTRSCLRLVQLFKEDLRLEHQLSCARRVLFMEAGDLMHEFCSQVFKLLDSRDLDLMDSTSLTLLLQDCLAQRYSNWAENFCCSYTPPPHPTSIPSLEGLTIHMAVPWPLNIILSGRNLATYNRVFVFLAGVKRALWSLQSVRLMQLVELDKKLEQEEDSFSTLSDSSLAAGPKQHRLQLLRSWLLYFVTVVHGYFMSRVLATTELELRDQLSRATDLDQLIAVHQAYIDRIFDRCFLHPSASMLREAVTLVLGICLEVHSACTAGVVHTRTITSWEEKYSRCHNFLASTLHAMTRERRLPHLEGLAAALIYSCPQ